MTLSGVKSGDIVLFIWGRSMHVSDVRGVGLGRRVPIVISGSSEMSSASPEWQR
jgi:hypothetical protein